MRIAVIGAGPAGITAAIDLQSAGHDVVVHERHDHAGGRTRTIHYGPGHWLDTGAGWLTDFYPAVNGLLRRTDVSVELTPLKIRGGGELMIDGVLAPAPNSIGRILASRLLSAGQKVRFLAWMAWLFLTQSGNLTIDRRYDDEPAVQALRGAGEAARDRVVRSNFEGPFFARLEQMNGTLVRSWLRSLSVGAFFQVDQGMDRPWRLLSERLDVRYGSVVEEVVPTGDGVRVVVGGVTDVFDKVVIATPAPVAAALLGEHAPDGLDEISYAPHARVYVARRSQRHVPRRGIHIFPNRTVATVEQGSGGQPAWGNVPHGWEWALLCAPSASSAELLELDDDELSDLLFDTAAQETGIRMDWREYEIHEVVRWAHAVPLVGPGHYRKADAIRPPAAVVFAGDWTDQPCVEGAVRSGVRAAEAVLRGG